MLGVTAQYYGRLERQDALPLRHVAKVASVLGLTPEDTRTLLERAGVDVDFVAAIAKQTSGSASE
jgi:hypothetical protein